MRRLPKPIVAMVAGYAVGGGHVLHVCCDLTIAADNARFGQTGPRVGSFDGGFGASVLAAQIGSQAPKGGLVPLPPVRRTAGAGDGPRQHGRAARSPRGGDGAVVPGDARPLPLRPAAAEGKLPRPRGRDGGHPAARARHQPSLLRQRRGAGGPRGLQGQAQAGLRAVPETPVSAARIWLMAARVRTLPAAVAPVLVGTSLAIHDDHFDGFAFACALLGAVFIQVGTNLSNDYSDARRGADAEDRLGPVRVTAGGLVPPRQVLYATYVSFGLAVACGIYLVVVA